MLGESCSVSPACRFLCNKNSSRLSSTLLRRHTNGQTTFSNERVLNSKRRKNISISSDCASFLVTSSPVRQVRQWRHEHSCVGRVCCPRHRLQVLADTHFPHGRDTRHIESRARHTTGRRGVCKLSKCFFYDDRRVKFTHTDQTHYMYSIEIMLALPWSVAGKPWLLRTSIITKETNFTL